ncbi:MAG: radical SAM-associated putative lipoprotein [Phocaeicola sp.]|nr:radical SAM-associated putative lipoprotein [Phocaeicola sp.]MDE6180831.1 radical SAM-associated putative lipoprotein [Phocaeicola sp.]
MNMKKYMTVRRLLSGVLALLGFSSCGDEIGESPCEYGTPYVKFQVKGKVVSDKDMPLEGIQVIVRQEWNNDAAYADTVYTDEKGEFMTDELNTVGIEKQKVYFNDVDGDEHGGTFRSDSVSITAMDRKEMEEGKGWYRGKYEFVTREPVKLSEKGNEDDAAGV